MYKLVFFVPESHLNEVKDAVFDAGAGKIGDYDQCCWQIKGQGQFRPLAGANPFIGQIAAGADSGALERVDEYRVEMVCADSLIKKAISALREAHPYEEPAFDVWQLSEF